MTKEEYFALLRDRPDRYPAGVADGDIPPWAWVAEAWDLREIRKMMVEDGMTEDVMRHGSILPAAVPFLEELSPFLRTDQVVDAFLFIREICPHKERTFRPQFERVFQRHAPALPPRMSRQEVLDGLRLENRGGQWFSKGKPATKEQLIEWHWLDEEGTCWLLDGVPDAGDRES